MNTGPLSTPVSDDNIVARVADEYLARLAHGDAPQVDDYAKQYPHLAELFRQLLPTLAAFRQPPGVPSAAGDAESSSLVNRQVGPYRVLREIGRGGMGVVYEAEHLVMQRRVALKVLSADVHRSAATTERFLREMKMAARLNHPNVVIAHDAGNADDVFYLAMELIDGADLATLLEKQGPLPWRKALDYTLQASRGLEYAHSHGVIHRDVKPSNLLVDLNGVVRVMDLGLARLALDSGTAPGGAVSEETITASGQIVGSLDYMAPEQAENTSTVDGRADIYSLGCTLYRMLTGELPFGGSSAVHKLLAHRLEPIPSISERRPDVPRGFDAVFNRMVAKRPEDRFESMTAVIRALEFFAQHDDWSLHQGGLSFGRRRHGPWILAAGGALTAAALIAAFWPDSADDVVAEGVDPLMARIEPVASQPPDAAPPPPPSTSTPEDIAAKDIAANSDSSVATEGDVVAPPALWNYLTAASVLKLGGSVTIVQGGASPRRISQTEELTRSPFQLLQVQFDLDIDSPPSVLTQLSGTSELESIIIGGRGVTDQAVRRLNNLPNLTELSLRSSSITDQGLAHLMRFPQLNSLSLYRTRVTDAGCQHLVALGQLTQLALSHTAVGDEGVRLLTGLHKMEKLYLVATPITDAVMADLAGLDALQVLWLDQTAVGDEGVEYLAALPQLHELRLSATRVSNASVAHLAQFKHLRLLDVSNTAISGAGADELRRRLPNCQVVD